MTAGRIRRALDPAGSIGSRREARQLTTQRAGRVSQRFAAERLDRYVRSHLRWLVIAVTVLLAMSVALWLALWTRPGFQGLVTGFMAGVGLTLIYHWCVISSGATSGAMGQAAEEWTDTELRRLRGKGWRHINHLVIKPELGDIDHVAVGPDGVLVVETKWRSHDEDVDSLSRWMDRAIEQAARNRRQVVQLLNWHRRDQNLVQSLVVLWGPEVTHESAEAVLTKDVNVIAGQRLRDELAHLSDERLTPAEVEEVYTALKQRIAARDRWEGEHLEPAPVTLQERATQLLYKVMAGWTGLFLAVLSFRLGWWSIPTIMALAAAGWLARRFDEVRSFASAFLVGALLTIPLLLIAVLWAAIAG